MVTKLKSRDMSQHHATSGSPRRAVVLTALPEEFKAVQAHLEQPHEEVHATGTVYLRGTFDSQGSNWDVLVAEIGMGNPRASQALERAIQHFSPRVALFVGIAGGLKDVKLGDVVAATKIYGFEFEKADKTSLRRTEVANTHHRIEQRARAEAHKDDWHRRITSVLRAPSPSAPKATVGPIAAGEKIVASTESPIWSLLRDDFSDALAVEMEGFGFLQAAHSFTDVEALVVRGISDLIDDKAKSEQTGSQRVAAEHASAFAFEVLAKLEPTPAIPAQDEPRDAEAESQKRQVHRQQQMSDALHNLEGAPAQRWVAYGILRQIAEIDASEGRFEPERLPEDIRSKLNSFAIKRSSREEDRLHAIALLSQFGTESGFRLKLANDAVGDTKASRKLAEAVGGLFRSEHPKALEELLTILHVVNLATANIYVVGELLWEVKLQVTVPDFLKHRTASSELKRAAGVCRRFSEVSDLRATVEQILHACDDD